MRKLTEGCQCEYADQCCIHPEGEGCVLKHNRIWVMNCGDWLTFQQRKDEEELVDMACD